VVVGGGATSCELISELYDFISVDLKKWYPDLMPHIKLTLVEASSQVLGAFSQNLAQYTMRLFRSRNIKIITNANVVKVDRHEMHLKDGSFCFHFY
jgi:NADH dehydrogenase FAD-containing subunit